MGGLRVQTDKPVDLIPVEAFLRPVNRKPSARTRLLELVEERAFKPNSKVKPLILGARIDWEAADRSVNRNWRMQLQGWMMFNQVLNAFDTGTAKAEAVGYFLEIVADWWGQYGDDPEDIVTTRMPESYAWYDMSVGFRALVLSFFLNRIRHYGIPLAEAQRQLLDDVARKHMRHLMHPEVFSLNNHGIFQMHGLLALTHTADNPDSLAAERARASRGMIELLFAQFDEHGVHLEHSPSYHFYAIQMFSAALRSGWYEGYTEFTRRLDLALAARKWLIDPLKRPICVGDSTLMARPEISFPEDDAAGWLISDFDSSGYAVLRSAWSTPAEEASMVFLMGGHHSISHKHRDCLSFDWFDKGRRIICDGGKYGYHTDDYRHYALSYAAHNNIEFEGHDIMKMPPYGSAIEGTERLPGGLFRMSATLRMTAGTHARHLHVKPGHWIVVEDVITQERPHPIKQRWHLDSDFHMQNMVNGTLRAVTGDGLAVTIEPLGWRPNVALHRGDSEPPVQGYSFRTDQVLEPALAVTYSAVFRNSTLLTVIALSEADRRNARDYCSAHFGLPAAQSETLPNVQALLPDIEHQTVKPGQKLVLDVGRKTYTILAGGLALSFFAAIQPSQPRRLLVLLPGASSRNRGHLDFQRHTWAADYPGHDVVSFSDPSLKPGNDIGLAWFQNSPDRYGLDALAEGIARICEAGGYAQKDVVFFGSSGGGFAGLKLAPLFPEARVIAINPQISLPKYSRRAYHKMLGTCYPGYPEKVVLEKFGARMEVSPDLVNRPAPVFIFQNNHDKLHVEQHLAPLLDQIPPEKRAEFAGEAGPQSAWRPLNVIRYDDAEHGHSPPSRAETNRLIAPLLAGPV